MTWCRSGTARRRAAKDAESEGKGYKQTVAHRWEAVMILGLIGHKKRKLVGELMELEEARGTGGVGL